MATQERPISPTNSIEEIYSDALDRVITNSDYDDEDDEDVSRRADDAQGVVFEDGNEDQSSTENTLEDSFNARGSQLPKDTDDIDEKGNNTMHASEETEAAGFGDNDDENTEEELESHIVISQLSSDADGQHAVTVEGAEVGEAVMETTVFSGGGDDDDSWLVIDIPQANPDPTDDADAISADLAHVDAADSSSETRFVELSEDDREFSNKSHLAADSSSETRLGELLEEHITHDVFDTMELQRGLDSSPRNEDLDLGSLPSVLAEGITDPLTTTQSSSESLEMNEDLHIENSLNLINVNDEDSIANQTSLELGDNDAIKGQQLFSDNPEIGDSTTTSQHIVMKKQRHDSNSPQMSKDEEVHHPSDTGNLLLTKGTDGEIPIIMSESTEQDKDDTQEHQPGSPSRDMYGTVNVEHQQNFPVDIAKDQPSEIMPCVARQESLRTHLAETDDRELSNEPHLDESDDREFSNKPDLDESDDREFSNKPDLDESDDRELSNKPDLAESDVRELSNKPHLGESDDGELSNEPDLAESDDRELSNKPESDDRELSNKPHSDESDDREVRNKPHLAESDVRELSNKPDLTESDDRELSNEPDLAESDVRELRNKPHVAESYDRGLSNKIHLAESDVRELSNKPESDDRELSNKPESDDRKLSNKPESDDRKLSNKPESDDRKLSNKPESDDREVSNKLDLDESEDRELEPKQQKESPNNVSPSNESDSKASEEDSMVDSINHNVVQDARISHIDTPGIMEKDDKEDTLMTDSEMSTNPEAMEEGPVSLPFLYSATYQLVQDMDREQQLQKQLKQRERQLLWHELEGKERKGQSTAAAEKKHQPQSEASSQQPQPEKPQPQQPKPQQPQPQQPQPQQLQPQQLQIQQPQQLQPQQPQPQQLPPQQLQPQQPQPQQLQPQQLQPQQLQPEKLQPQQPQPQQQQPQQLQPQQPQPQQLQPQQLQPQQLQPEKPQPQQPQPQQLQPQQLQPQQQKPQQQKPQQQKPQQQKPQQQKKNIQTQQPSDHNTDHLQSRPPHNKLQQNASPRQKPQNTHSHQTETKEKKLSNVSDDRKQGKSSKHPPISQRSRQFSVDSSTGKGARAKFYRRYSQVIQNEEADDLLLPQIVRHSSKQQVPDIDDIQKEMEKFVQQQKQDKAPTEGDNKDKSEDGSEENEDEELDAALGRDDSISDSGYMTSPNTSHSGDIGPLDLQHYDLEDLPVEAVDPEQYQDILNGYYQPPYFTSYTVFNLTGTGGREVNGVSRTSRVRLVTLTAEAAARLRAALKLHSPSIVDNGSNLIDLG